MEGLEKIDKWLHVWTEAEREARVKKPAPDRLGTVQVNPENREEDTGEVTRLPRTLPGATHDE